MEAVAQDLIDRKITSPSKLACIGGSNGGLVRFCSCKRGANVLLLLLLD